MVNKFIMSCHFDIYVVHPLDRQTSINAVFFLLYLHAVVRRALKNPGAIHDSSTDNGIELD